MKKAKGKKKSNKMPKQMNVPRPVSTTGNLLLQLNVKTAGSVNGMKGYPYLYRTTLR
jgi:hypothetical protein